MLRTKARKIPACAPSHHPRYPPIVAPSRASSLLSWASGSFAHRASLPVQPGESTPQPVQFGSIIDDDVRLVRVPRGVILMKRLRYLKAAQRPDFGDNRPRKAMGSVQSSEIAFHKLALLRGEIVHHGTVLGARVRSLAIALGRVMGHGEEHLQQFLIADLRGIVAHPDRLDPAVGVSGDRRAHALEVVEDGFDTPEAATRKYAARLGVRGRRRG